MREIEMDRDVIFEKLAGVIRDVFDDDSLVVTDSTTADDVDEWDSANHVRLIIAIEEEFGVRFGSDEMAAPETVGQLVDLIRSKQPV